MVFMICIILYIHATIFKRNHNSIQAVDRLYTSPFCVLYEVVNLDRWPTIKKYKTQTNSGLEFRMLHAPPPPPPPTPPIQKVQATALAVLITL